MTDTKQSEIDFLRQRVAELEAEIKLDADGPDWVQRALQAEAELAALKQQGEPVYWQWRKTAEEDWSLDRTFNCELFATTDVSEVRPLYTAPPVKQGEPVGYASYMPGTTGFTMVVFESNKVPVGTKLYTSTQPIAKECFSAADMAEAQAKAFREGQQSCESA